MVVFTCNNCGDSLQKPKVAKHYQFQCRKSISLTCVDCFKDFLGDDYVAHTKCITEAERYGSKDYVAKPSANKGEKKQQEWIKIVNDVINNADNLSKDEKSILHHISKHENIPRKKVKFLNFVQSSMGYRVNKSAVESCWTKIEVAFNNSVHNKKTENSKNGNDTNNKVIDDNTDENCEPTRNEQLQVVSKKRKQIELSADENSHKQPKTELCSKSITNGSVSTVSDEVKTQEHVANVETKVKFDWKTCILNVFGTRDEMTLKKLEKKVVAKCLKHSDSLSQEKAISRFHKKLNKISEITLIDGIVKRVN